MVCRDEDCSRAGVYCSSCRELVDKTKEQTKAKILKIIDEILPMCICKDDDCVDKNCPSELLDGVWSNNLNLTIRERIEKL